MYTEITLPDDLPPQQTTRWVKSRKLSVIKAIEDNRITKETAIKAYNLSEEELASWYRMLKNHGPDALRTTHLNQYRSSEIKDQNFHIPENLRN